MPNPTTVNVGLIVPLTGADVDLWGENDVNPDLVAIDGMLAGVQAISVSNAPVTLTAPAGFVPTPSGGPTQAQNRVLRFTGVLTANVRVTLPIPGSYIIENLTSGNFVLSFQGVTATEVIGTPQGERLEIYNDGANVRFVNLGRTGSLELWGGETAMPAWVSACTVLPYLLADGTVYAFAVAPYLAAKYLAKFGGNGLTTFGVQDLRGRMPLAYDGTGTRITVAGCGLNGQTMGAVLDQQSITLTEAQLPVISKAATRTQDFALTINFRKVSGFQGSGGTVAQTDMYSGTDGLQNAAITPSILTQPNFSYSFGGGTSHPNVPPTQVVGIWVVKT